MKEEPMIFEIVRDSFLDQLKESLAQERPGEENAEMRRHVLKSLGRNAAFLTPRTMSKEGEFGS